MTESEFLDIASGQFLCESYPSEAALWDRQSRADYCEEFKCEDFEYFTGNQIYLLIEDIIEQLKAVYQQGLKDGKE